MTDLRPVVGSDRDTWGTKLLTWLGGSVDVDGTLKAASVRTALGGSLASTFLKPSGDATGATDQAALIAALITGGNIVCTPGTYYYTNITQTLTVPTTIIAYGATWKSTLNKTDNTVALNLLGNNITILGGTWDYVTSLTVDSDAVNRAAGAHTIRLGGAHPGVSGFFTDCLLRDVAVLHSRNSPFVISGYSRARVIDCTGITALGNGVLVNDCPTDVIVRGNFVSDTGDDAIAVLADADLAALCQRVTIVENTIYKTYANGIDMTGVDGGVIDKNHIDTTWAAGIKVWHDSGDSLGNSKNVVVGDGNVIKNAGTYFGGGQFKTTVGSGGYGVQVVGDLDGIVIGYPRIVTPQLTPYNFGVTGSGNVRRTNLIPQRVAAGGYIRTPGATSTVLLTADRLVACPIWIPRTITATSLNIKVTAAGSVTPNALVRMGIYTDSGEFTPNALLLDAGTVDASTGHTGVLTIVISQALQPGLYWLVAAGQNSPTTQATVNCLSGQAESLPANQDPSTNINGVFASSVSGALPATFTVAGNSSQAPVMTLGF